MTTYTDDTQIDIKVWPVECRGREDGDVIQRIDVDLDNLGDDLTVATIEVRVTEPEQDNDDFPIHRVALEIKDADTLHSITIQGDVYLVDQEVGVLVRQLRYKVGTPDPTPNGGAWCGVENDEGFFCTWHPGHPGDHVAGTGHHVAAVWPSQVETP